jgi:hypothetical protein
MLRRPLSIGIATAVAWALTVAPALAAGAVLTAGGADLGADLGAGDVLHGQLAPGTKATFLSTAGGSTGVGCAKSSFTATVTTNPPAPGTATLSVTAVAFGDCTANMAFVTGIRRITVNNLPYTATIGSGGGVTVSGNISATIVLIPTFGTDISCTYGTSSLTGTSSNPGTVTFTNQVLSKTSGPGVCFSTGFFSATYVVTTAAGQPVVLH